MHRLAAQLQLPLEQNGMFCEYTEYGRTVGLINILTFKYWDTRRNKIEKGTEKIYKYVYVCRCVLYTGMIKINNRNAFARILALLAHLHSTYILSGITSHRNCPIQSGPSFPATVRLRRPSLSAWRGR